LKKHKLIYYAGLTILILSLIMHIPKPFVYPSLYSDINALYYTIFINKSKDRWFINPENVTIPIPYVHYLFEYPPVIAYLFMISTNIASKIPTNFTVMRLFYPHAIPMLINYLIHAIVLLIAGLICIRELILLAKKLGKEPETTCLLFITMPSFILFSTHNWDLLATAFMLYGLRKYLDNNITKALLSIGLAAATKIIPGVALIPILLEELKTRNTKRILQTITIPTATVLTTLTPFLIMNPQGLVETWEYLTGYYAENSWLVWFFHFRDPKLKTTSLILTLLTYAITTIILARKSSKLKREERIITGTTLYMGFFLAFSYIYTPQMNLLITPFLALTLPLIPIFIYLFDITNAALMLIFFTYHVWTLLLNYQPLHPMQWPSPTIWLSTLKITILLLLITDILHQVITNTKI